uniref:Polyadenylate-binding protein 2 n=1 Tax=Anthurium amnicola TaxID=1678845 RepID=A0A1D1XFB6_9ARAE
MAEGVAAAAAAAPPPPPLLPAVPASLYVGDLDEAVDGGDLIRAFIPFGTVSSARVCRDYSTGVSLRYAYVNFASRSFAENALKCLNHTPLHGKPMRIMWSQRNPLSRKSGEANLFVKNLDASVDGAKLEEMFGKYGVVLSCKVATEGNGQSKGFGFVQFDAEESAQAAIKALHGSAGHGNKALYVAKFVKKSERQEPNVPILTNVYIKNLDHIITDDVLLKKFSEFGKVKNAVVMKDELGLSKGFGFVSFELPEDAKRAIEAMNGALFGLKTVYVGKAQTRTERDVVLRRKFQRSNEMHNCLQKIRRSNVYVKNFDVSMDDKDLRQLFIGCGKIISAKVMRDAKGFSRGFGFVSFSRAQEAEKAILTLNGAMFQKRRLYVAMAQRKEDRQIASKFKYPKMHLHPPGILRPHNCSSQIYSHQTSTQQQYGLGNSLRHHPWQPSPMLLYQQGHVMYGGPNLRSGFPYSPQPIQLDPFVSQWYPPVHGTKNILWMQPTIQYPTCESAVKSSYCSRGHADNESKQMRDMLISPLQGKLINGDCYSPLLQKVEFKTSRDYDGHVADKNGLLHVTGAAGCTDASSHASANRIEGKSC